MRPLTARSIVSASLFLAVLICGQSRAAPIAEDAAVAAASASRPAEVYTRAIVRSVFRDASGGDYIRLKLVPRAKLPFTTLTYRVLDRGLIAGVREGDSVAFRSERTRGENVLTAIRVVPPCVRFQKCE
jgi:Cu/Ag efflux protein CusF